MKLCVGMEKRMKLTVECGTFGLIREIRILSELAKHAEVVEHTVVFTGFGAYTWSVLDINDKEISILEVKKKSTIHNPYFKKSLNANLSGYRFVKQFFLFYLCLLDYILQIIFL